MNLKHEHQISLSKLRFSYDHLLKSFKSVSTLCIPIIYCCFDLYIKKPEICNVESPLIRKISHAIGTLAHLAILGISSTMIYYGDGIQIILHSISMFLLVWILLCSIFCFGCKKDIEENDDNESIDVLALKSTCYF